MSDKTMDVSEPIIGIQKEPCEDVTSVEDVAYKKTYHYMMQTILGMDNLTPRRFFQEMSAYVKLDPPNAEQANMMELTHRYNMVCAFCVSAGQYSRIYLDEVPQTIWEAFVNPKLSALRTAIEPPWHRCGGIDDDLETEDDIADIEDHHRMMVDANPHLPDLDNPSDFDRPSLHASCTSLLSLHQQSE